MKLHKHILQAIVTFPSIVLENVLLFFGNIWDEEKKELDTDVELDPEADA